MSSSNLFDLSASNDTILMATISSKIWRVDTSHCVVAAVNPSEITPTNQITIVVNVVFYLLP